MTLTFQCWKDKAHNWMLGLILLVGTHAVVYALPILPPNPVPNSPTSERTTTSATTTTTTTTTNDNNNNNNNNNKDSIDNRRPNLGIKRLQRQWAGEKLKLQCDVRVAGFELNSVRVVWALRLLRMSDSGCGPHDPVLTLAELRHVNSDSENDQVYLTLNNIKGWTLTAEGARLGLDVTNARTAWVGLTIDKASLEDSGTYRCDALVGEVDSSLPMRFKTSFTTVKVSNRVKTAQAFSHVTVEESVASVDYDPSVISTEQNHRFLGQPVNVTCAPRLLRQAPTLPFSVSHLYIRFLPFRQEGSRFRTVAEYFAENDTFASYTPNDRKWRFTHVGVNPAQGRNLDSLLVRINLVILNVTLQDTGIFDCAVTKATTGNTYHAEAGLKVSDDPQLRGGYCDPQKPRKEEGNFMFGSFNDETGSDDSGASLDTSALKEKAPHAEEEREEEETPGQDAACMSAVVMMGTSIFLLLILAWRQIYNTLCCVKKKPKKKKKKRRKKDKMKPGKPKKPKKKKKKKKKPMSTKHRKEKKVAKIERENRGGDWSPFTSYHFDYFHDYLYEDPCIPLDPRLMKSLMNMKK